MLDVRSIFSRFGGQVDFLHFRSISLNELKTMISLPQKRSRFWKVIIEALIFLGALSLLYLNLPDNNGSAKVKHQLQTFSKSERNNAFARVMMSFPWDKYQIAVSNADEDEMKNYSEDLLQKLLPFLVKTPPVPLNESCSAPSFRISKRVRCHPLESKRKVGMVLTFGFEVDALEIYLHELDKVVDRFFLIESLRPRSQFLRTKRLMWENMMKFEERFEKFQKKIVHFVVDESSVPPSAEVSDHFQEEKVEKRLGWTKFLKWNEGTRYFGRDDILGFGEVNEIPDRSLVFALKHCKFETFPVDAGIWVPFPYLSTMFKPDMAIRGHPYALRRPSFWTLGSATEAWEKSNIFPNTRNIGSSSFLLGGMLMSRYAYPPYEMVRLLSSSETNVGTILKLIEMGKMFRLNDTTGAALFDNYHHEWTNRTKLVEEVKKESSEMAEEVEQIVKVPWLIQCNPKRYPSFWEGGYDLRLEDNDNEEDY